MLEYIFYNKKKQNIFLLIKILKNLIYNIIIDNIYRYTRKFFFLKKYCPL